MEASTSEQEALVAQVDQEGPAAALEGATEQPALPGLDVWFLVADENREPLPEASVTLFWGDSDSAIGTPRELDGLIWIGGVPEGLITIEASCPGYVTRRYDTIVPWVPERMEGIQLEPAASLVGRVLRNGLEPGPLTVFAWPENWETDRTFVDVAEDAAGFFRFDEIPIEKMCVTALSPRWGQSEVATVMTRKGETVSVDLELSGDRYVTGVVIDQETGQVLRSAEAKLMVGSAGLDDMGEISSSFVDGEGRFLLPGAAVSGSSVVVTARGYSRQTREVRGTGPEIDLGTIALPKTQLLTICLVSDQPFSSDGFVITSEDGLVPTSTFDAEGCLTIEDVAAEYLEARVVAPDETYFHLDTYLIPGQEWRFEIPVKGYASAHVTFGDVQIEREARISLLYFPAPGVQVQHAVYVENTDPLVIDGLPPGVVKAYLSEDGEEIGSDSAVVEGTDPVELHFGTNPSLLVRVVDPRGQPIAGAAVYCRDGSGESSGLLHTDEQGLCQVTVKGTGSLLACVSHPQKGIRSDVPLPHPPLEAPFELVIDPSSSLEVAFRSSVASVAGLNCALGTPDINVPLVLSKDTDAAGVIRWDQLHAGRYFVHLQHPRLFPFDEVFDVSGRTRVERTLRGRGSLAFTLVDGDGLPLAGVPVALRSVVDGTGIDPWLETGWVEAPLGLVTDIEGRIVFEGLPTGPFEWTAAGRSGTSTVVLDTLVEQDVVVGE